MQTAEFVLERSKKLTLFIHVIYVSAVLVLLTLQILLTWKFLAITILIVFWKKELRLYATTIPSIPEQNIMKFWHKSKAQFILENHRGICSKAVVKGDSFHCAWFIILRLKTEGSIQRHVKIPSRTITLFIARDALTDFEYRRLSQRLLCWF